MKVIIDVNKDTSKLLTDLIDKMNSTKMGDLDKSRSRFESMIHELESQLADTPEKDELIEFFKECIDDDEELVTIDKDPNIIDNKTLININTRKMNKKDLIKQELGEIESILKNKAYSQLLAKYHARLFSDVEGLEGEDIEEIKERLDNISDQLEEISNTEAVSDESVEVSADEETAEAPEDTETETEEVAEEGTEESTEESTDDTTSAAQEASESEEEVKTESEEAEETEVEETEESVEEVEESPEKQAIIDKIAEVDESIEELKEAVETKDFSKVIARHFNRLFSEVGSHEELIENIDEVKEAMDDLAEKIEKLDAETDEDSEDKHEGEEKEVEDAEHAEEEAHDADEQETEVKTESEDRWVLIKDGRMTGTKGTKEEIKQQLDEFGPADRPHYAMKPCSECKGMSEGDEVAVTAEEVEQPAEVKEETPSMQEVESVAEQAAEEAVEEYMENGLFMNEVDNTMPGDEEVTEGAEEAIVSEEVPEKEAEVEPMYIDEKTEMVLDPMETEEVVTESEDWTDMEDENFFIDEDSEQAEFCNKTFSKGSLTKEDDYSNYEVASIEDLLGI